MHCANARTSSLWRLIAAILLLGVSSSPLRAADKLEIWPKVSIGEMLTDNLPQETTRKSGNDAISAFAVGGTATLNSNNRTLNLDYVTDAEVYARHSHFDQAFQDQYIGLSDYERLTPLTGLSINDTFINGQQAFGQSLIGSSEVTPLLSQALLQNSFLTNDFTLSLNRKFSERLSTVFTIRQTFFNSSSQTLNGQPSNGQTSESFNQGAEATAYYALSSRLSLGPDFQFNDFRFSSEPRADSYQPSLAAKFNWNERLRSWGTAGPLIISSPNRTRVDFGYTLGTEYKGERWLAQLFSGRTPSISGGTSGASVSQYEGAAAGYWLTRYTSVFVNGSFIQFSQTTNSSYGVVYGGGLIQKLTRSLSLSAQFLRFQTNSRSVNGNVTDTLMIGMKYAPSPWIWTF